MRVYMCVRVCASVPNSLSYLPANAHKLVRIKMRVFMCVRVCASLPNSLSYLPANAHKLVRIKTVPVVGN